MTLRTVAIPDPPAGVDWQTIVPGNYLYHITGITATITTGQATATTAVDASGNNRDGTYDPILGTPQFVTGLVSGDLAWLSGTVSPFTTASTITLPTNCADWDTDFTICWWCSFTADFAGAGLDFYEAVLQSTGDPLRIFGTVGPGMGVQSIQVNALPNAGSWVADDIFLPDGTIYFCALTWDGADLKLYIDGALYPWTTTGGTPSNSGDGQYSIGEPAGGCANVVDEWATFKRALSAGELLALYVAGQVDIDTYSGAVLALTPFVYYHLDDGPGTGRQVALTVGDGINVVEFIPPGFDDVVTPGPYAYSWQPNLPTSTQTPDGTITTVAIPQLILPAGYTVGTNTIDIAPDDQWSNVTLWWSDDVMNSLNPYNPYAYPPGATLVSPYLKVP